MAILKLKPAVKEYLWGGRRLIEEYHVETSQDTCAEAWELSCRPEGESVIVNGAWAGRTLREYIDGEGWEVLGTHCRRFREFPILIKFIDARDNLSIQVHPGNSFALQNEGQYGKTEMWYVLDAEPDACLYYGFQREISTGEFAQRIRDNTLLETLNRVHVKKGDSLFIESGTIHAIGRGMVIAEIQQNSNITYRVYDYGRVDKDGKKRDLHIEKALAVTNRVPIIRDGEGYPHVADCDYFTVDKLNLDGRITKRIEGEVSEASFLSILILDGEGTVTCGGETLSYRKGDSLFLPAGAGAWQIRGTCDALLTTIREKASPVRIGITIGSGETRIGLVDSHDQIIASHHYPTGNPNPASRVIREAAENTLELLRQENISLDQCIGIGVGVPGTVDRKSGKVIYSNNISWQDVSLARGLEEIIPCPVRIANDADCAAMGEAVAGAGKDFGDMVMLTLGNGVGGGIILGGRIFEGGVIGGGELGHQVIRAGGRPCTCGRRGCLEAYVSVPALLAEAVRVLGREVPVEEIFDRRNRNNTDFMTVLDQYIDMLGIGVVNIINMFRPQLIILGGNISPWAEQLVDPVRGIAERECFGSTFGKLPEFKVAKLGKDAGVIGAANL
ncbi:MAG: ROK family protein [Clostridium sp.]|nr:ROK family protein [Clostridium sp.]